ncbi:MAG: ribonuclease III [bacterium]
MNLPVILRRLLHLPIAGKESRSLGTLQRRIGYQFRDEQLLETSLTHRSFTHNHNRSVQCNERLEFLGDSVLGLLIGEQLYRDHTKMQEGNLTQTRALLVNESTLADLARKIELNRFVRLASEEERAGGRDRTSIIADTLESIIGAVYLDGGLDAARDVVLRLIYAHREEIVSDVSRRNFKGELLELVQARGQGLPRYDVISEDGPDHEKVFQVEVHLNGQRLGLGSGLSKKEAEQKAAAIALEYYVSHSK